MTDWQPISTAPKDGKPILLYCGPKSRYKIFVGVWNAKWSEWQSAPGAWPGRPVRWMPLPPPTQGTSPREG